MSPRFRVRHNGDGKGRFSGVGVGRWSLFRMGELILHAVIISKRRASRDNFSYVVDVLRARNLRLRTTEKSRLAMLKPCSDLKTSRLPPKGTPRPGRAVELKFTNGYPEWKWLLTGDITMSHSEGMNSWRMVLRKLDKVTTQKPKSCHKDCTHLKSCQKEFLSPKYCLKF